jgi:hypothetical protein
MADRKTLTLWDALLWAYRKQRAHVYLSTGYLKFEWAIAASGSLEGGPRPTVAWDAAMLHDAVCDLPGQEAEAVMLAAVLGERPELPGSAPVPLPYEIDGHRRLKPGRAPEYMAVDTAPSKQQPPMSRPGRGMHRGRRVEILIRTIDFEVTNRPTYERRGRSKITETGTERVWMPVEYCPLRWEPDPGYHAAAMGTYKIWRNGMVRLASLIPKIGFREHTITVEPIPEPPDVATLEFDSWGAGHREFEEIEAAVTEFSHGEMGVRMFESPILTEKRARATII